MCKICFIYLIIHRLPIFLNIAKYSLYFSWNGSMPQKVLNIKIHIEKNNFFQYVFFCFKIQKPNENCTIFKLHKRKFSCSLFIPHYILVTISLFILFCFCFNVATLYLKRVSALYINNLVCLTLQSFRFILACIKSI